MLGGNKFHAEGTKEIAQALLVNRTLAKLNLGSHDSCIAVVEDDVGEEGAKALGLALLRNHTVNWLCLGRENGMLADA